MGGTACCSERGDVPIWVAGCATPEGAALTSATFSASSEFTVEEEPAPTLPSTNTVSSSWPLDTSLPTASCILVQDSSCKHSQSC